MATDSITRQGGSVVPFRVPAGRPGRPPGSPPGELVAFHPRGEPPERLELYELLLRWIREGERNPPPPPEPPEEDDPTPYELFRRWLEASERTGTPPPGPVEDSPREVLLRWRRAGRDAIRDEED